GAGTIFAIATDGTGFTVLRSFAQATDGGYPAESGLIQGTDGRLYGTTSGGGASGAGTIFAIATDGTGFTVLRSFAQATDGGSPAGSLIQGNDGRLYGANTYSGMYGGGTIFAINK